MEQLVAALMNATGPALRFENWGFRQDNTREDKTTQHKATQNNSTTRQPQDDTRKHKTIQPQDNHKTTVRQPQDNHKTTTDNHKTTTRQPQDNHNIRPPRLPLSAYRLL